MRLAGGRALSLSLFPLCSSISQHLVFPLHARRVARLAVQAVCRPVQIRAQRAINRRCTFFGIVPVGSAGETVPTAICARRTLLFYMAGFLASVTLSEEGVFPLSLASIPLFILPPLRLFLQLGTAARSCKSGIDGVFRQV